MRDVKNLKSRIDPLSFYRQEIAIEVKKMRDDWFKAGLCPFHADKTSGSFYINKKTGAFVCFSCGAKGGDILAFKMLRYGLSFVEAVNTISKEWGEQ